MKTDDPAIHQNLALIASLIESNAYEKALELCVELIAQNATCYAYSLASG
jgi:hypothetical protein